MLGAERRRIPAETSLWTLKADCMDVNLMSPTFLGWPSQGLFDKDYVLVCRVMPPLHSDNIVKQLKLLSNR